MTMDILNDCAAIVDTMNNNHIKHIDCMNPHPSKLAPPICIGCSGRIVDQYIMKVHPDLCWHINCLKCFECNRILDETCTCYFRDGKVFCKPDYQRLFAAPCAKCGTAFNRTDYVMRAESYIYHIDCFHCTACSRSLVPGDEFALRDGSLYCREDNEVLERNALNCDENRVHGLRSKINSSSKIKRSKDGKPTRVRTVLSEKQLHTLRTCYGANPRPDALMKEQLVEMTGLSPRVIRVWFQNKRCKDKKKSMLLKHMQHQDKNISGGTPMVAHSPLCHDGGLQSIESYHHQSWKRIPEFPNGRRDEHNNGTYASMIGSLYSSDDSTVYLHDDEYMDCAQPGSVSSQFSHASTSPNSSG